VEELGTRECRERHREGEREGGRGDILGGSLWVGEFWEDGRPVGGRSFS